MEIIIESAYTKTILLSKNWVNFKDTRLTRNQMYQ